MDYKEKVIALLNSQELSKEQKEKLEEIFPELAESEDERIKKSIIEHLKCDIDDMAKSDNAFEYEAEIEELSKYIAWLEKQGEQKPAFDIDIPFGAKDSELMEASYYIPEGFHAGIEGNHVVIKKGEQKPSWSEEDEYCRHQLIVFCENCMVQDAGAKRCAHWLKSLKDRYTWKPSDLQIEALDSATENCAYSEYQDCLRELIAQLKKLKRE